ncbi:MAG TPA: hypothetical protein VHZ95_05700 [Polyangiales bacterium]|jgi:hypothetical protein|nr:hypothetical protein [Polyangiales bacterium]
MNVASVRRMLGMRARTATCILLLGFALGASTRALAQPLAADADVDTTIEQPTPKPAPYSLPFQLRPAAAGTVLRLDNALAFYEDPTTKKSGSTYVPMLLFSYKLTDNLAPLVRLGVVQNSAPNNTSGFGFLNPVLGATYALKLPSDFRLAFFLGVALPVGSGGGDHPDADQKLARNAGILARSAMDNAMFAVNDLVIFPGVDFAFVSHGFTAQVEATLLELTRVRGDKDQPDKRRTNLTAGLHLGYFFIPELSAAVELRHQRWLSTPKAIAADKTDTLRDTTTLAFGPRVHIPLAKNVWLRPSLALVLPLDDPMKKSSYKVVQLDLPLSF